ncbi:hypothetical protein ATANTOWER_018872 [Ataeniobius toweri]|uniref:Retrotransposon gag domain-containing protein n=1 Tax=Ataeniobius toweri TaxID=208326 RepID=A0ABU7BR22_9TELE|nr:hypothetical protein [Ataeniobius toweri]
MLEGEFKQRADYTIINQTKQKIGEPITDYRIRMEEVFKSNSGLQLDNADDSPYQQQLKNALQTNALPNIRNWVTKHNIDLPTCSVSSWQNGAMHAEKMVSGKIKQPPTDTFYAKDDIFYAGPVFRGRGRMRGIFRGRGGDNDTC